MKRTFTLVLITLLSHSLALAAPAKRWTDAQILELIRTSNATEAQSFNIAKSKANDPGLKAFAEEMVILQDKFNNSTNEFRQESKISTSKSELSEKFRHIAQGRLKKLGALEGPAFDRAYLKEQMIRNEKLLETIDKEMLPSAQAEPLKAFLKQTRDQTKDTLARARDVSITLRK